MREYSYTYVLIHTRVRARFAYKRVTYMGIMIRIGKYVLNNYFILVFFVGFFKKKMLHNFKPRQLATRFSVSIRI